MEQREARLTKMREYNNSNKAKRQNETTEQRQVRLAKMREYKNLRKGTKKTETTEQREARLAKERERKTSSRKRASQKQSEGKGNHSSHPIGKVTSNPVCNCFQN